MSQRLLLAALLLCAFLPIAGCSPNTAGLLGGADRAQQDAAKAQRLSAAKVAAASTLADVEVCESTVLAGPSLDDLSRKAIRAQNSVAAFSRTNNARLLPGFTSAIARSARGYMDCCAVWRADEVAARAACDRALSVPLWSPSPSTIINDYRHPMRYRTIWVQAGIDVGQARLALRSATQ